MEKVYRTMHTSGLLGIVLGSLVMETGAVCGGLMLATGVTLLVRKKEITF